MTKKTNILCIFDGFGLCSESANNAISLANMPHLKRILQTYSWATLSADGEAVGQEAGLVGNSEVGHMNIGGLKLVPQLSFQITKSSENKFNVDSNLAPDQIFDPKDFLGNKYANKAGGEDSELPQSQNSPLEGWQAKPDGVDPVPLWKQKSLFPFWNLPKNKDLEIKAKELRKTGNLSEVLFWKMFNKKEILGFNIDRQVIIGNYIVDFFIPQIGLVIEIDGQSHDNKGEYDLEREKYLQNLKLEIIHYQDSEIKKLMDTVSNSFQLSITKRVEELKFKESTPPPTEAPLKRGIGDVLSEYNGLDKKISAKTTHLVALFSTGTIHSDMRHWVGAIEAAGLAGVEKIVLHLITDGRDSDRKSLVESWHYFVTEFKNRLQPFEHIIYLGSLGGRFYAMDRDKNWERVAKGCKVLFSEHQKMELSTYLHKKYENVQELNPFYNNLDGLEFNKQPSTQNFNTIASQIQAIAEYNYQKNVYDEYIEPISFNNEGISKNDTVWLINFRTDRMKQFSQLFCDANQQLNFNVNILAMNDYGDGNALEYPPTPTARAESKENKEITGYYPIFKSGAVVNTLAETISLMGKTQLHIAETEKYNHVTYFMNGGQDKKWQGEDWMVILSNKVASHAEKPEMKAKEVTDYIVEHGAGKYDYIIVNYANPDMVGHAGNIKAAVASMEFLDQQLGRLLEVVETQGHKMIIIADHGNIEKVGEYEENGKHLTDTEHNANPVPCIFIDPHFRETTFINELKTLQTEHNLLLNIASIEGTFKVENYNLSGQNWLTKEDINQKMKLPLWYAGVFLLGL